MFNSYSISFLSAILVRVGGGGRIPKNSRKLIFSEWSSHLPFITHSALLARIVYVSFMFEFNFISLISTLDARIVQFHLHPFPYQVQFHINSFPQQLQKQLTFIFTFQQEGQITNKEVTNCNNNMLHITFGFLFCCKMLVLPRLSFQTPTYNRVEVDNVQ